MKKVSQGEFEIFTTKADSIVKFKQLQGVCREELSDGKRITFRCSKKGQITITNPPTRHVQNENATELFAEIIERDGKTYVTYYTAYSYFTKVMKIISIVILIAMSILAIILGVAGIDKTVSPIVLIICLIFCVYQLFCVGNEQTNSHNDSEIMIKELEKRVEAVNRWDE